MITVTNEVHVYEVNGRDTGLHHLTISNHWNDENLVVVQVPNSKDKWAVARRDLETAIQNATNNNRHG